MDEYHVTCIEKSHPQGGHEHIIAIGGSDSGGWTLSKDEAIKRIDSKSCAFYTVDLGTGRKIYVSTVRDFGKPPYLRTHADGKWNDNLLAQAACPYSYRRVN